MRNSRLLTIVTVALMVLLFQGSKIYAEGMGTAITYQGRLIDGNEPAEGEYDFEFKLYDGPGGSKSVYSYLKSGLSGYQHANVSQNFWTENSVSTTCDYVTLWISGDGYTVSSRYFWRILLVITDGNDTESEILRCDCWGLNEGCNPNHYDYYDETKTSADGRTWKRYTREIPGNLDKSKLTIKIVHDQASWDWTSASSWFRLDNVCFSDSQGNICQFIENGNFEKDPVGTSFGDISSWEHSSEDAHGGNYDENLEIVDDYYCDISNQIANSITIDEFDVIDGYFTVALDFNDANAFNGDARWLQIGVRPGDMNDPNAYTTLDPRQEITPTPYALYARQAGTDGDWQVSGNDMYSIPSGNVGIGTSQPAEKLHIDDGSLVISQGKTGSMPRGTRAYYTATGDGREGLIIESSWTGTWTPFAVFSSQIGRLGVGILNPMGKLDVSHDGTSHDLCVYYDTGNVGVGLWNAGSKLSVEGNVSIGDSSYAQAAAPAQGMIVQGNVGIGTPSPAGKLDVNGSIYQRGGLLHADYVFEPHYELESIEKHSELMWQNKHLPAVPEANIDKNGQEVIEIGAHQRGIVEELEKAHIYIGLLNERNKELEQRITALEKIVLRQQSASTKEVHHENH